MTSKMLNETRARVGLCADRWPVGSIAAGAMLLLSGCPGLEQGSVFIQGVKAVEPAGGGFCSPSTQFLASSLLDLGENTGDEHDLTSVLAAVTNLPATTSTRDIDDARTKAPNYPNYGASDNNVITFTGVEVFFSTDLDGNGSLLGNTDATSGKADPDTLLPLRANPRVRALGGTVFNNQGGLSQSTDLFATLIGKDDAAHLKADPKVKEVVDGGGSLTIIANARVLGLTTGGASVRSPPFPFPVDLCKGCLAGVPACVDDAGDPTPAVVNPDACFPGVDQPSFSCPTQ